jgi:hypothetical protein
MHRGEVTIMVPDLWPGKRYRLLVKPSDRVRSAPEFGSQKLTTRKEGEPDAFVFTTRRIQTSFGTDLAWADNYMAVTVEQVVCYLLLYLEAHFNRLLEHTDKSKLLEQPAGSKCWNNLLGKCLKNTFISCTHCNISVYTLA